MKKLLVLIGIIIIGVFYLKISADEPSLEEINHATELYQKAGEEFDQAQALFTEANAVLSKVDAGEDVPVDQINEASEKFNKASEIFAQAEQDYKEANKILNYVSPEEETSTEEAQSTNIATNEYATQGQTNETNVEESSTEENVEALPEESDEPYLLYTAHFELDSAELSKDEKEMIEENVISLGDPTVVQYYVFGYTDNIYSEYYNLVLSVKRAMVIRNYLIYLGIPAKNITVRGMGEKNPIGDNKTQTGREENRRVEIYIK